MVRVRDHGAAVYRLAAHELTARVRGLPTALSVISGRPET
jgi:hypothetical protein